MQEFEFRAWHEGAQKMLYEDRAGEAFMWLSQRQPVKIMQFTGLRDKNGKRIFGGDIVVFKCAYCGNKKITATVTYDRFIMSFVFGRGEDGHFRNDATITDLEVIGNIYENPELIQLAEGDAND